MDRAQTFNIPYGQAQAVINGLGGRGQNGPNYIKRLDCNLALVLVSAGSAVMVPGRRMIEALNTMDVRPVSGLPMVNTMHAQSLRMIQWNLFGKPPLDPPDLPANAGVGPFLFNIPFSIPFCDQRRKELRDGGVPLKFYVDGNTTLSWQGAAFFGAGVTIDPSTQISITPIYEERYETDIGERVAYEEVAVTGWDSQPIPPGLLTDALLVPIDGSAAKALTVNSFSQISSNEDGDRISINQTPDNLIRAYNRNMTWGEADALPQLYDAQTEFIPLVWLGKVAADYGDVAISASKFEIQATVGSDNPLTNNYRIVVRRVLPADVADMATQVSSASPDVDSGTATLGLQIANRVAQTDPDRAHQLVKHDTSSSVPLAAEHSTKAAVYGRFLGRTAKPGNLKAVAMAAANNASK